MPTLSDLDNLYKRTVSQLPTADKLDYCSKQLDHMQKLLDRHSNVLDSYQKNQVRSLIRAIQDEISKLEK